MPLHHNKPNNTHNKKNNIIMANFNYEDFYLCGGEFLFLAQSGETKLLNTNENDNICLGGGYTVEDLEYIAGCKIDCEDVYEYGVNPFAYTKPTWA